ncbi:MAG: copper chaperone PCu(A)C [Pseudomonadales bacterium]|nr:copper chaperone PCu(A)C [Pseudomonadales bacterium]MDG1444202.1 copper chaperone PCu(A)C [Pseudomonadales bacterium]
MFERKRAALALVMAFVTGVGSLSISTLVQASSPLESSAADSTAADSSAVGSSAKDNLTPVIAAEVNQTAIKTIEISRAWSRATPPGAPMGAIYMDLQNHSLEQVGIESVSTDVAELSEVHQSIEVNGVMRMREVAPFLLPKNRTVSLQPGGKHVMLMRLKQPLKIGSVFTLLVTDSLGTVHEVPVKVGGYGQMSYPK